MIWRVIGGIVVGLAVAYAALLVVLLTVRRERSLLRESLRLLPDLLRLVRRLAADRTLPRSVRWRLAVLLAYLALPFDVVPDFIPVLGYADDALAVAWVLRAVVRTAGPDALARQWPGTPDGLRVVQRLAGLHPG